MSWVKVTRILDRDAAIAGLTRIREEWQGTAEGVPLSAVQSSVGLLLLDVVNAIGLLPEEAARVLDEETYTEQAWTIDADVVKV